MTNGIAERLAGRRRVFFDTAAIIYTDCLLRSGGFTCFPVDAKVARSGAELRATHGLRLPDALNLAVAETHGADAFLTNDHGLRERSSRMDVVVLEGTGPPR